MSGCRGCQGCIVERRDFPVVRVEILNPACLKAKVI